MLLALDGADLARTAIRHVQTLAGGTGAEVVILQVIRPIESLRAEAYGMFELTNGDPKATETLVEQLQFDRRQRAELDVDAARKDLETAGVRSVRTEVGTGLAGNVIVDCAAREDADAIVMATRGHGGLGREVMGSVAEYVLRHAGNIAVVLVGPRPPSR